MGGTHVAVHDEHSVTRSAFGVDYNAHCSAWGFVLQGKFEFNCYYELVM